MQLATLLTRAASRYPDKVASIFAERRKTWTEVTQRASQLAGSFHSLGVEPGDRIALLALNSDRYLEIMFASVWADGVIIPMNTRWSLAENLYSIEDSTPHILLVDDRFAEQAQALTKQTDLLKHIIYLGDGATPAGMLNYEELLAAAQPAAMGKRGGDDLAGIFYTGGTTGFPKGVMLSHANLLHSALYGTMDMNGSPDDIYLHAAPMFHLGDGSATWGNTLMCASHTYIPEFDPLAILQAISTNRVTGLMLVPTMLQMLFDHPQFKDHDISSLHTVIYGASPMPQALLERVIAEAPNLQLFQGYGQTELAPIATILRPEDHQVEGPFAHRRGSVGRTVVGVQLKIIDENHNEVAQGEHGQIAVRGKNAMLGYWNKPEQTRETLIDGWVLTGDAGYLDADGYLFLMDRVKDMIISGGENVFSVEVENALTSHPDVQSAAVIGVPSADWGEAVHGIVITKPGKSPTKEELVAHCKQRIAGYKCPKGITFRTEPMPLSGAGKVLKTELRKPFWEGHEKAIN